MATKNGLVTLVVPVGDVDGIFASLDKRASELKNSGSTLSETRGVELAHLRDNLFTQAKAQGYKSL
jgi:hypothetical protein